MNFFKEGPDGPTVAFMATKTTVNSGAVWGAVIFSIVALFMVIIGVCQFVKKDNPVGFYNLTAPPNKDEITDIIKWNRQHGMIWIAYGICIELGFWLGWAMPTEFLEMLVMIGCIVLPLPFMDLRHKGLVKMYCRENVM